MPPTSAADGPGAPTLRGLGISKHTPAEGLTRRWANGPANYYIVTIISSLRAFRRARDGDAKGGGRWERIRWPDVKLEVTGAKCDLRNEQQREKREESREKREERSEKRETSTIKMRGSKDAMVRSQNGGMAQKRDGP